MTLDQAEEIFRASPLPKTAAALLTVATQYWNDDMIGDETFADKVRQVRDWLRQDSERQQKHTDIVVVVDGGIVQSVVSDNPLFSGRAVTVLDYDTDGGDENGMIAVRQPNGKTERAYASAMSIDKPGIDLNHIENQMNGG